jgi:hypothetical protein
MTRASPALIRLSIAITIGSAALLWNGQLPLDSHSPIVSSAEARIGRPLTPMSYAGVARRTTRRAVAVGAAGATIYAAPVVVAPAPVVVAPAPAVAAPRCAQLADAYGRIVTVCR